MPLVCIYVARDTVVVLSVGLLLVCSFCQRPQRLSQYFARTQGSCQIEQIFRLKNERNCRVFNILLRRPRGKRRPAATCTRMPVMLTVQSLVHEKLGQREG